MTGFTTNTREEKYNYERRRAALRATWFPGTPTDVERVEASGIAMRFVVGHSASGAAEEALGREAAQYGGFLRLPIKEAYSSLPYKVLVFVRTVLATHAFEYLLKVDDDVYLRGDRVLPAIQQWRDVHADYVGCMKQGDVLKDRSQRWYEPQYALLGGQYFTHAWGSAYVLSAAAAQALGAMPPGRLRFFSNEDVTVGSWMLAFNMSFSDDRRLCEPSCSASSLVVYDYPTCAGLCNAAKQLPELHGSPDCRGPAVDSRGQLPRKRGYFRFAPTPQLPGDAALPG